MRAFEHDVHRVLRRTDLTNAQKKAEVGRLIGVYSDPRIQVVAYGDARRVHAINLCFEAVAGDQRELGTPDETLALGFFGIDALPTPFVPIHAIRVSDAALACRETRVR